MKHSDFKKGDVVVCVKAGTFGFAGRAGSCYTVAESKEDEGLTLEESFEPGEHRGCSFHRFKLLDERVKVSYEDEWYLNDGSSVIPDDAETLMNPDGTSVVAYRKVKKPQTHLRELYGRSSLGMWGPTQARVDTHAIILTLTEGEITDVTWRKL